MTGAAHQRVAGFPTWLATIDATLPVTAQYVLHGNLRDFSLMPDGSRVDLDQALWQVLQRSGYQYLIWHRPSGLRILPEPPAGNREAAEASALARTEAARALGVAPDQLPAALPLEHLLHVLRAVTGDRYAHGAVAVDYVSQWRPAGEPPGDAEHTLLQGALGLVHGATGFPVKGSARPSALLNPVFWLVDRPGDLPGWLTGSNGVRSIPVPMPDLQARTEAAERLIRDFDPEAGAPDHADAVRQFANATEGMTLRSMVEVVQLCRDQGLGMDRVTDAVRSHRVGLTENPWAQRIVKDNIRNGFETLSGQVFGQERAIRHALDILARSSLGMTAAYAGRATTGPRGILFFAGPTGVGKTELAKAITRLVFGDERAYIRLDMSEFSSEQSEARLIGSPPGYVGHGAGGELTNAVRQRPFSLVLFDEIEKAHPRIMDKFLQILSDGRLTDGSGSTVHFGECIIVFTSNLGIRPLADGEPAPRGSDYVQSVVDAISEAFTHTYHRPELLGRIGRNNIVVFDYISPEIGRHLADSFVDNVLSRTEREAHIEVTIAPEARRAIIDKVIADLSTGGRGIALAVEDTLVNPLSRQLIQVPEGTSRVRVTGAASQGDELLSMVVDG